MSTVTSIIILDKSIFYHKEVIEADFSSVSLAQLHYILSAFKYENGIFSLFIINMRKIKAYLLDSGQVSKSLLETIMGWLANNTYKLEDILHPSTLKL